MLVNVQTNPSNGIRPKAEFNGFANELDGVKKTALAFL